MQRFFRIRKSRVRPGEKRFQPADTQVASFRGAPGVRNRIYRGREWEQEEKPAPDYRFVRFDIQAETVYHIIRRCQDGKESNRLY